MKRKIGELRNVPIVEGDKNLVRGGAEIHINDLQSKGSSSGSSSKYVPRYFNIDFNTADEGWKYLLSIRNSQNTIEEDNIVFNIGANYKSKNLITVITSYPFVNNLLENGTFFSYIPLYIENKIASDFGIKGGFLTFEDIRTNMPILLKAVFGIDIILSMNGITEITEEEFYKID